HRAAQSSDAALTHVPARHPKRDQIAEIAKAFGLLQEARVGMLPAQHLRQPQRMAEARHACAITKALELADRLQLLPQLRRPLVRPQYDRRQRLIALIQQDETVRLRRKRYGDDIAETPGLLA